jgi:hypothetical protein
MRRVAARFAELGRGDIAERCLRVAVEEQGHDRLALDDLDALGYDGEALVERLKPKRAVDLVALLTRYAESGHPIACFGYAYALERSALFDTEASIAAVERFLPAGVEATRCLRVHSAAGADADHTPEAAAFIASLPAPERAIVLRAVHETASLMTAERWEYPGDTAMHALVDGLERTARAS